MQVSGGLLCLHTGLSVDSLEDSSVTGIPQPGSSREWGVRVSVCVRERVHPLLSVTGFTATEM